MAIRDLLQAGAPARIAVRASSSVCTYQELSLVVDNLCLSLDRMNLRRGDRIAMALPNGLEIIACFLAAATVGTAAPLNPAYTREEFKFYLEDTRARALIVPATGADQARSAATDLGVLLIEASSDERGNVRLSANERLDALPETATAEAAANDQIALMLHTSGTTSRPKRVPLSHNNLLTSARNVANTYQLSPADVSLCVMPLFHVHGLVASTLATFATGGSVVVPAKFNPLSFWQTMREHHVTWYSAVPTIHQVLITRAKRTRPAGAEQLRFIRSCSASLAPQLMSEMEETFGAPVLEAYGMTEAAHQMASNPLPPLEHKPGSVGRGTEVEIAILDEAGNVLPPAATGEVSIKGKNVFSGYEGNPEANAESFTNGWFRTGDQGTLDSDGYLTLVGRIKELINRGGEKISPREIDETLLRHPAVAEACCFGIPDRTYGEGVAAAVVLKDTATEKDLIVHCRASLSDFKCPTTIYIMDAIPRTATGKIQRRNVAAAIAGRS
ncbi:MAG TPA: acyl--CoA ligase [Pyrinomonadaceae bacterium]|jgi:acyl-CoA synthetase (AMP-forming)/AMP-acid ligase II|nr:acyl--CoA ligase [Pyrinomonadaceae bacterium]